jgi:hypothetical protein
MVEALGRCAICGDRITAEFWFCADCEARYGLGGPIATWPDWARYLKREHEAARIGERDDLANLDDSAEAACVYDRLCYGESE